MVKNSLFLYILIFIISSSIVFSNYDTFYVEKDVSKQLKSSLYFDGYGQHNISLIKGHGDFIWFEFDDGVYDNEGSFFVNMTKELKYEIIVPRDFIYDVVELTYKIESPNDVNNMTFVINIHNDNELVRYIKNMYNIPLVKEKKMICLDEIKPKGLYQCKDIEYVYKDGIKIGTVFVIILSIVGILILFITMFKKNSKV
jgi:hypothetical protein